MCVKECEVAHKQAALPGLEGGQGVKECGDRMEVGGEEGVCGSAGQG